jgi:cephamycin C biosynthesis protein
MRSFVNYSAPIEVGGPCDDWLIDAVSSPPDVLYNFLRPAIEVEIADLRKATCQPTLHAAGFERLPQPTGVDQCELAAREESALNAYQEEMAAVLKVRTGADMVVIFDATSRFQDTTDPPAGPNQSAHLRVHVDQNPRSAHARVDLHAGVAKHWPLRRFQIINLWRPLLAPVLNYPLALCDCRTVDVAADLVATKLQFPPWLKDCENYSVMYSPNHRWFYWSTLTPDEILIFKCYDSASRSLAIANGELDRPSLLDVAGLCPHTAVFDPAGPTDGRLRTSLELRALALYR